MVLVFLPLILKIYLSLFTGERMSMQSQAPDLVCQSSKRQLICWEAKYQ